MALSMLLLASASSASDDYAVRYFNNPVSESVSYTVTHEIQVNGPVNNVWRWVPLPRQSSYDGIFNQTPTGTATISTSPDAAIHYDGGIGAWVEWPDNYNVGNVLRVTVDASVRITARLDGDFDDVVQNSSGPWTEYTTRVPYVPEAATVAANLRDNWVPGTCREGYGTIHRIVLYLNDTISSSQSTTYEQGSADQAWALKTASFSGFTNLFMSMCRSLGIASGYMMGNTFSANIWVAGKWDDSNDPGSTITTYVGPHSWAAVDDGSMWLPVDAFHGTVGFVTTSRVLEAQAIDQSDVNIVTTWEGSSSIGTSVTFSGSGGGGESFITKDRWASGGTTLFVHYPDNPNLRPRPSNEKPTVGVPDGPYLDPSMENAFLPLGNPAHRSVQFQLYLQKPANRMQVHAYDVNGRMVAENIVDRNGREGYNFFRWDPGPSVPRGVYFIQVVFDGREKVSQRIMYLK